MMWAPFNSSTLEDSSCVSEFRAKRLSEGSREARMADELANGLGMGGGGGLAQMGVLSLLDCVPLAFLLSALICVLLLLNLAL